VPHEFGLRLEDIVAVDDTGTLRLNVADHALAVL